MPEKDAYYFPHDSNAKDDHKCMRLISQLGLEGYGIFWVLIEILRDQPDYRYPVDLLSAIAERYKTSTEKVKAVIINYKLFESDQECFWSPSLIRRMTIREQIRENAIKAGLASAQKRRLLNAGSTGVQRLLNAGSTGVQLRKERKGKEILKGNIDKKKYGQFENVLLSDEEYEKLKIRFNSSLQERIEELSIGIASKGYKYKSHYAALLSWERKREKDGGQNGTNRRNPRQTTRLPDRNTGYTEPPPDPALAAAVRAAHPDSPPAQR